MLSDDKRAIAIGSAQKEKFVGGPAIKAAFKNWRVSAHADLDAPTPAARANISADGELMWVALSIVPPPQLCVTYRALFVLAKEPSGWKIVHQHDSERYLGL